MNVLLINPPIENMITTNIPDFVDTERGYNPSLGIMYIAAYAEKYTDHKIEILDMIVEQMSYDMLENEIKKRKPDVVGITTTTFTLIDSIIIAKIINEVDNDIKIIFGGPHAHIYPEETINIPEVDFLVLGEGEITFTELLQKIENYEELKKVKGIVFKNGNRTVNTGYRGFIEHLDSLPFPARHLTPYKKYYSLIAKRNPITTMFTSRGCPYRCLFCHRPHMGKKFRARAPENVVEEIEECVNMGIHEILIYDDTFTLDRKRVLDVCNLIKERDIDIYFDIRSRIDRIDKEMLIALKEAGCLRIHYGVESANQRILDILRKDITVEQAEKVIKMTKDIGIETLAYFMIGNPTETKDEILNTIQFAKKLKPDYCHFSVTMPFPATPLYELGLKKGVFKDYWKGFASNPTKDFVPQLWEENLSREELIGLLEHAYKSFYTRPSFVFKKILKVRSFDEFKRKAKAGMRLLK
ncbi:MAG: radical SAM protein [Methanophagales archaeon]|nr:radical SAM protein [Methanophagales archaeon]